MGCGASAIYSEDGGVMPGKGSTKIEWAEEKPIEVGFYAQDSGKIMTKEFPLDKEVADKVFDEENVVVNDVDGIYWIKLVPGQRASMKYVKGNHPIAFNGQRVLDLPKKIHTHHTQDDKTKEKLISALKKDVEKEEGHPFNGPDGDEKVKAMIDDMANMNSASEFPDEFGGFKKASMAIEDLHPWNTITPKLGLRTEPGHWEEKDGKLTRVLDIKEKVMVKGEEEVAKKGPELVHKGMAKVQEGFHKVIEGAVQGACKKVGPEASELAPGLPHRLDMMDGCVPGVGRAQERKKEESKEEEEKKEEDGDEDPLLMAAKAEYEATKGNLGALKDADSKDRKRDAESYLKDMHSTIEKYTPTADEKDRPVIAKVQDGGVQVPVYVQYPIGDEVQVQMAGNNFQDEAAARIPNQVTESSIEGTTATECKVDAFTTIPSNKNQDWLIRGQSVIFQKGRSFCEAWIKACNNEEEVQVEDQFLVSHTVKKKLVYTHLTQQHLATRGLALVPNYGPLKFWWIAPLYENDTAVKLAIRPLGAPDSDIVMHEMTAVTAKAMPSKENKEPTHEVHRGYCVEVAVQLGVKHAFNFRVGEDTYLDFGKKAANENSFKVFTCHTHVDNYYF